MARAINEVTQGISDVSTWHWRKNYDYEDKGLQIVSQVLQKFIRASPGYGNIGKSDLPGAQRQV